MAVLVDDAIEAALGPWGLAIGAGVGLALLARRKLAPAAGTVMVGGVVAGERARGWVAELGAADRARAAVAEVSDWWSDLCAEARAEWEAGRAAPAAATVVAPAARARRRSRATAGAPASAAAVRAATTTRRAPRSISAPGEARPKRERGADGRFVRQPAE